MMRAMKKMMIDEKNETQIVQVEMITPSTVEEMN